MVPPQSGYSGAEKIGLTGPHQTGKGPADVVASIFRNTTPGNR